MAGTASAWDVARLPADFLTPRHAPHLPSPSLLRLLLCRPPARIEATEELRQWSKRMALAAPVTFFRHQPQPQAQQHVQPNQRH